MSVACPSLGGDGIEADVIVVGAGPAGSSTAAYLADRGLNVALLEKTSFPREKICGDGLTPRAVRQLVRMGIDVSDEKAWPRTKGLRVYAGRNAPLELPWPAIGEFPPYGLVRSRREFDQIMVDHAVARGATLHQDTHVTAPVVDDRSGRITGVQTADGRLFRAPIVVAADGNSSRLAVGMGIQRRPHATIGVAIRTYFTSPHHDIEYLESWLDVHDAQGAALPGYGWVFGLGDGTCNVGLGVINTAAVSRRTNYRALLDAWLATVPPSWGFSPDNQVGGLGSAALPMAFSRQPAYTRGLLLVGDSGGMISPYNGEGIGYAIEAGEMAADAITDAYFRGVGTPGAERALEGYPVRLSAAWGSYFRWGELFAWFIGHPAVMRACVQHGLPRPVLMRMTMKWLSHLWDTRDGDWMDNVITLLTRMAPAL